MAYKPASLRHQLALYHPPVPTHRRLNQPHLFPPPRRRFQTGQTTFHSRRPSLQHPMQARPILSQRLDKLVVQFKTSAPEFFNAYQTARAIVDLPATRKTDVPPAPAPQPA